jgi:AraC-like DNA-binding protein
MAFHHDQAGAASSSYRETQARNEEELNGAIPGAIFDWVADSGPSFTARYRHLVLDGIVLTHLTLHQPSYVTLGERIPGFNIWHAIGPAAAANGRETSLDDLVLVRPGEGATLRTGQPASIHSFALRPEVLAEAPELELPFGPEAAPQAGHWHLPAPGLRERAFAQHRSILAEIGARPALLETPATRASLQSAMLEALAALGEAGRFEPGRASAGRHTRIMLRFEQIIREAGDEPLTLLDICRLTGASRRSLTAIVLERTGRPPWEYLRWRRLWRARALLSRPKADTTVTDVAFSLGFWHLGRFAAAYAETFGERPSLTLARANGTTPRTSRENFAQTG